uniref:Ribonuclease HII n=1 Tax=viral metagenome TaxID=1070528 RepID=A0A6C0BUW7_9ZZZZ
MNRYYEKNKIELGIDEAGRGCLIGPVCISGVILGDIETNPPPYKIRDSKKCSPKIRKILREYIETNSIAFSVQLIDEKTIDKLNILKATMKGMHLCVDDITKQINIDTILVDGNQFDPYLDENFESINHICIPKGDDKYLNIAAASILAKEYHDEYIEKLVNENPVLNNYKLLNNKGYGTKDHINAIKEYGHTNWHRKSFKI